MYIVSIVKLRCYQSCYSVLFNLLTGCSSNRLAIRTAETHFTLVLSSPNYPQHYDSNMDCLWRIQTDPSSGPDYIIKVTFQDFELEDYFCKYDNLKFYDGPLPQESTLLGSYCGTLHPDVIYSRGKYLYVKFHSDSTKTYKGFRLHYTAVKKGRDMKYCTCNTSNTGIFPGSRRALSQLFFLAPRYLKTSGTMRPQKCSRFPAHFTNYVYMTLSVV